MSRVLIILVFFGWGIGFADTIHLRADVWCPYNCEQGSTLPGYIIEAASLIFEKAGHKIDYQTLNWSRTIREVHQGVIDERES